MAAKKPLTREETARIQTLRALLIKDTYYDALGLPWSATKVDVERAYRTFAMEWHPDRFFSRDCGDHWMTIEENFVQITRAYETLRDEKRRAHYDDALRKEGRSPRRAAPPAEPRNEEGGPTYEVTLPKAPPPAAPADPPPAPVAAAAPAAAPTPPPPPTPQWRLPAVEKIRNQLAEQFARASYYYKLGKEDYDAGQFVKAESSLYLATRYDPSNEEYKNLHAKAVEQSRLARALALMTQAEQSHQYGRTKEALVYLQKAVDCEPSDGRPYYRLARLMQAESEGKPSDILALLRKATLKDPANVRYRLTLAEAYIGRDMKINAQRELQAVLAVDAKNESAQEMLKKIKA